MRVLFSGHYDKCIAHLMERNKDDMAVVTGNIFSNLAVQKKNALVIMLIVSIRDIPFFNPEAEFFILQY